MARRIVFDIRALVDSTGHSDGIVRTLRALARYAATERSDVVFAIFDLEHNRFRAVNTRWLAPILDGAKADTSHFIDPLGHRKSLRGKLPIPLRRILHAVQRPGRRAFVVLEGLRLASPKPPAWLSALQTSLMSEKLRSELRAPDGSRRLLLPFGMATGELMELASDDVVLFAGFNWSALYRIAAYVACPGSPHLVSLCHDIIPLMFPQFFQPRDVARFRACYEAVFAAASLMLFTTHRVEDDVRRYCADRRLQMKASAVVPLGVDVKSAVETKSALPERLEPERFMMFVSTIEPRKNHRMLFEVWKRLLADGAPQSAEFKLVLVGRRGWQTDDLVAEIEAHPCFGNSLLLLSDVDDAMLATLYKNAAFCLYPSLYEGFGLPVIESFLYGKAVVASTGGALPETVGDLSPCLDPVDEDAWFTMLRQWIVDPAERAHYEARIAEHFAPRSWHRAARDLFDAIDTRFPG